MQMADAPTDESMHKLNFDHNVNSIAFKHTNDSNVNLAVGSMILDRQENKVEIFKLAEATTTSNEQPQQPQTTKRLVKISEFQHEYPPSKIVWEPALGGNLIATAGENVKIWMAKEGEEP